MTTNKSGKKAPKINKKMVEKIRKQDERITRLLLDAIENGGCNWVKDWRPAAGAIAFGHKNHFTGTVYAGGNAATCAIVAALEIGTTNTNWITPGEAAKHGWTIDADATPVYIRKVKSMVGHKQVQVTDPDTGEVSDEWRAFHYMAVVGGWTVYNCQQVQGEGVPHVDDAAPKAATSDEYTAAADRLIATSRCPIIETPGDRACYSPTNDRIMMPQREQFTSTEGFLRTLLHEMTHSTAAILKRPDKARRFGDAAYAFEELVAELGAAFAAAGIGYDISSADYSGNYAEQHAAYLKSWSRKCKSADDRQKQIFKAATFAIEAAAYIIGCYNGTDSNNNAA